jgi:hypothetical protein
MTTPSKNPRSFRSMDEYRSHFYPKSTQHSQSWQVPPEVVGATLARESLDILDKQLVANKVQRARRRA